MDDPSFYDMPPMGVVDGPHELDNNMFHQRQLDVIARERAGQNLHRLPQSGQERDMAAIIGTLSSEIWSTFTPAQWETLVLMHDTRKMRTYEWPDERDDNYFACSKPPGVRKQWRTVIGPKGIEYV